MKKSILLTIIFLIELSAISDNYITRGPNPGEIYFYTYTYTGFGLYHSFDYGQTINCVDSNLYSFYSFVADKTPGVIYCSNSSEALYRSDNYGYEGSWILVNGGIYDHTISGIFDGVFYNAIVSHSIDYGFSFIQHSYNGFFGDLRDCEMDSENNGYCIVTKYNVYDTLYILKSTDDFNNLSVINKLHWNTWGLFQRITRGSIPGELYLFNQNGKCIINTLDYGESWLIMNDLNIPNNGCDWSDIVGGHVPGELFYLYTYNENWWQDVNIYILHSTDYGISFEVIHPFSIGEQPLLANFSGKVENFNIEDYCSTQSILDYYRPTGEIPFTVNFSNFSIGDDLSYSWDFNNDGIIDSYEQSPTYTYNDTGYFSVRLTIHNQLGTNSFIKNDYIYAYNINTVVNSKYDSKLVSCSPNPFTREIVLSIKNEKLLEHNNSEYLDIYDIFGKKIKSIPLKKKMIWDGKNQSGSKMKSGTYYFYCQKIKAYGKILFYSD